MLQAYAFARVAIQRKDLEAYKLAMVQRAAFHAEAEVFEKFVHALEGEDGR